MSDTGVAFIAAISLIVGVFIGIAVGGGSESRTERLARERAEMEMMLKLAPIWCGQDGCQ